MATKETAKKAPKKAAPKKAAPMKASAKASQPSHEDVALAAYYNWLNRPAHEGDQLSDWLAAESKVKL